MGGTAANRITTAGSGLDGKVLGGAAGNETITLTIAHLPSHTHAGVDHLHGGVDHTHTVPNHSHGITVFPTYQTGRDDVLNKRWVFWDTQTGGSTAGSGAFQTTGSDRSLTTGAADRSLTTGATGSGSPYTNMQPTIILNKIIKT
jgi:microcystin-dependent protein